MTVYCPICQKEYLYIEWKVWVICESCAES